MSTQEKLNFILDVLREQGNPISIRELLELLEHRFAERSVRRWLDKLVTQGYVIKTGSLSSTRYQAALMQVAEKLFSEKALVSLQHVRQPIFKREPVGYNDEWVNGYRPNETFYLSEQLRRALSNDGKRQQNNEPAGTYAHKIYNRLLIDLTYNSSRLEGNTYSLLETQRLILEGASADNKLDLEKVMILNHKEAIRHLVDSAPKLQFDVNEICTIHYLLADGLVERKYAGQVRDQGVRIGASTYIPYENSKLLESQLTKICLLAKAIEDPFEQSFFMLTHIAYLQAFIDVNKRTARLSANMPLIKNNFVPLSFNDIEKDDYNSAMICIYEFNDIQPLSELYYYSYMRSCKQYNASVISLGFDRIRIQYRQQRRDIIKQVILKGLVGADINNYVQQAATSLVDAVDNQEFVTAILQDLDDLTLPRISGLGITANQLQAWRKLNAKF
jgi:Fic family protein